MEYSEKLYEDYTDLCIELGAIPFDKKEHWLEDLYRLEEILQLLKQNGQYNK